MERDMREMREMRERGGKDERGGAEIRGKGGLCRTHGQNAVEKVEGKAAAAKTEQEKEPAAAMTFMAAAGC